MIWTDPNYLYVQLLDYGFGQIASCDWCPCYCACCQGLIPSFGVDGGEDGPDLTFTVNEDGTDVATGSVFNGIEDGVASGPCAWLGHDPDEAYLIDNLFQDPDNGCLWTMHARGFGLDCFDTAIVSDSSACSGNITFTFTCGGHDWVITFGIPSMMRKPEIAEPKIVETLGEAIARKQAEHNERRRSTLGPRKPCNCGKTKKP